MTEQKPAPFLRLGSGQRGVCVLGVALVAGLAGQALGQAGPLPRPATVGAKESAGWVLPPELERALQAYTADVPHPAILRARLIDNLIHSPMCYSREMSQDQWDHALRNLNFLPPGMFTQPDGQRFFIQGTVWSGAGAQGASGRAVPTTLTFSFPADGVTWGTSGDGFPAGTNLLNARFATTFGAANADKGRELIRQSFGSWRRYCHLTYNEVADNNSAMDGSTTHVTTRGDVRVGAKNLDGVSGVLAYDNFPTGGSDMVLDSSDFVSGNFNAPGNNFRFFRNVVTHEHGHGLGYIHSVPCNETKLMEPFISVAYDATQIDEIRGAERNYGDRYAGNNSPATAKDFGNLTTPVGRSIIEKNLSTNGVSGFNSSNQDWFKFTTDTAQDVVITIDPTGGSYVEGAQSSGCTGTTATVNAEQAGNLSVELRDAAGTTVLMSSAAGGPGVTETITAPGLSPGTYTVKVIDIGPDSGANQVLQLYDMTIRVAAFKAPPTVIAGVNKRIMAGQTCFFMGNISTAANEPGGSITTYAWDLDGDGTFEIANNAQPTRVYTSNATFNVTLKATDNFGSSATDTITVTVFGATCPLNIDMQPSPQNPCLGGPASFSIAASGQGTPTFQWRHNNTNIPGATATTFTIASVAAGDAGNYDCVVDNGCAVINSNSVALTIVSPPVITLQPMSQTVPAGTPTVALSVNATGTGLSYQWRHNNAIVPGVVGPTLVIFGVETTDAGAYRCDVTNACGTISSDTATLTVTVDCPCDWNVDGVLNSQDFFDFVTSFFAGNADFNQSGATNSQDYFDFINCFFAGCP